MNVNVEVLCPACKYCKILTIEETIFWANDDEYEKIRYCKNVETCKKAVEIWEMQNATDSKN